MAQVDVKSDGVSRSASLDWNGSPVSLTNMGGGTYQASFMEDPGTYVYRINVHGDPGDGWTASVTDGTTTQNSAGHMGPSGGDSTGDTAFTVS